MTVRLTLLDGVTATRGGRPVDLGPPQRRAVLCALALRRRRWVPVAALIDALYDGDGPARAAKVVQTHVSALRSVLEPPRAPGTPPEVLLFGHGGYQLRLADDDLDLGRFERLVAEAERARARRRWSEADAAYTEALALFPGEPLAGVPGPYAERQRTELTGRRQAVTEDGLEAMVNAGRALQAVDALRELTAADPLRERPPALLMRALYAGGRRWEALEIYTRTRRTLVDRLAVEPGPELRALHTLVLAGDPLPGTTPPAPPRPAAPTTGIAGRAAELRRVTAIIERASTGGGIIVVSGGPGSGKSHLLREIAARNPGARRLRLADGLATTLGLPGDPSTMDGPGLAARALDALTRPAVLIADDAAEADRASRDALLILARRLRERPVVLILAASDPAPDDATAEWCGALEAEALAVLPLGALTPSAIADLVTDRLDTPAPMELAASVHDVTGGLPVLVTALIADLATAPGARAVPPQLVPDHLTRALARLLGAELGPFARALAVLDPHDPAIATMAAVTARPASEARRLAVHLLGLGLLASADPPRLRHPVLVTALRDACTPAETTRVLVAAATDARDRQRTARQIADHLLDLSGPQWTQWTPVLLDAATEAVAASDGPATVAYLTTAARIDRTARVLLRLGQAELQVNPRAGRAHLREALDVQLARGETPSAVVPLAWAMAVQGEPAAAMDLMDRVARKAGPRAGRGIRASGWLIASITPGTWEDLVRELRTDSTDEDPALEDPAAEAVLIWDDVARVRYSAAEATARLSERAPTALRAGIALWADDLPLLRRLTAQPGEDDAALDLLRVMLRAEAALRLGEPETALAEAGLVAGVPPAHSARRPAGLVAIYARALIALGRLDEAAAWLDGVTGHASPDAWDWTSVLYARAMLLSHQGDPGEAAETFLDSGHRLARWGFDNPGAQAWRGAAALELVKAGEHERARPLALAELDLAHRWGVPRFTGLAWRALAAASPLDERAAALERAAGLLTGPDLAAALSDLADAEPGRARVLLERARSLAGTGPLGEHVAGRLRVLDGGEPGPGVDVVAPRAW
ncbi:hypothetical protein Afil01_27810 [Actinorhabdospora filicis]|uniref:OmpR/PhoB-type domain-containing protein n=1 Tax=Actinorhabdospora filicis TaxID=1785913 RepID=A0A9W6W8W2_9ACTN|nr:AfsR/SARP family transcriptional regulator [Actinorhabdospora filicis]GLZ77974.1 hypothetical protein Afil01_27810 [Actinorhabdospora filicis]